MLSVRVEVLGLGIRVRVQVFRVVLLGFAEASTIQDLPASIDTEIPNPDPQFPVPQ